MPVAKREQVRKSSAKVGKWARVRSYILLSGKQGRSAERREAKKMNLTPRFLPEKRLFRVAMVFGGGAYGGRATRSLLC